ncbi:MAG: NAD-glutamate dehydrogenase [Actinomycetota bacterium]|nr:NAD-glutamate dehydrogenase [Actinomycetota bacterium]
MTDVVTAVISALGDDAHQSQQILARKVFRYVSWDDVSGFTPAMLVRQLDEFAAAADERPHGRPNVEVHDLEGSEVALATIVVDDMPFLVDSLAGALHVEGRNPRLILHPQLIVRRDADGRLIEIFDLETDDPRPDGTTVEAWIQIQMERNYVSDDNRQTADHLRRTLRDVGAAIHDWPLMREKASSLAAELDQTVNPGWSPDEVCESAALLRWMADEHFLFVGYKEYSLYSDGEGDGLKPIPGTALGVLREADSSGGHAIDEAWVRLSALAQEHAHDRFPLVLTKANSRSTVHIPSYLDYVGVKLLDESGAVIGERRFLGLYTGAAFTESITSIPILRERFVRMLDTMDVAPDSHTARDLRQLIETLPRDEFFAMHTEQLIELARAVMHLDERRQVKVVIRPDDYGRYVSAFVFLPRDRYNTDVRVQIEDILQTAFEAVSVDHSVQVTEAPNARLHFILHLRESSPTATKNLGEIEQAIAAAAQTWLDEFTAEVVAVVGSERASTFLYQYFDAFPEGYKERFAPLVAVRDAMTIAKLDTDELAIEISGMPTSGVTGAAEPARIKLLRAGEPMSLSAVLPLLQHLGVEVLDEYPFEIERKGLHSAWVMDFGVQLPDVDLPLRESLDSRFSDALRAAWSGAAESDDFNGLVVRAGLHWEHVVLFRSYARYLRQLGTAYGQDYLQQTLLNNPAFAGLLIELFDSQLKPGFSGDRAVARTELTSRFLSDLDSVPSLDHDRILRSFLALVLATVRTNAFLPGVFRESRALAFKIDSRSIADMPLPKPLVEIWVYSPRVEGVHLRFGRVARGGIRWSDRREDFRTEVLGLVKAQAVKNAVIVPVGAKGGFYAAGAADVATDREAWMAAGKDAYIEFISALLDLTDNLQAGQVIAPANVVRSDGDDPYLVVAADKGTASFSDLANRLSLERGFWLGDAFASGGSHGYDHKAMGITARGAWVSVQRHFRELEIDVQSQPFTVVGIGDMSGDVFGNGMLLSQQTRLIAAFDHRSIFIDPEPDAQASFHERHRIFDLPRSSWADFDPKLLSPGGAVFSRSAKSIEISEEAQIALGLPNDVRIFAPDELIKAILQAPVDLLWNGGIGTYVKAVDETQLDVGDKANDAIRIDGYQLRCAVVGEGGNLGFTQAGRIEAAHAGVRLNTDAIDNSAGVDTSDHEVNLKILLDDLVQRGSISVEGRDVLLTQMSDAVAAAVLGDNYDQNVVLGNARSAAPVMLAVHQRLIRDLEHRGLLDRQLEFLPSDEEIERRRMAGEGLCSPELAVLLAYSKMALTEELNSAHIGADPWYESALLSYFPSALTDQFAAEVKTHQLRNQLVSTVVCNHIVNTGGITFVFRAVEETGATAVEVVHAAGAASAIFGIDELTSAVNALDLVAPVAAQDALHHGIRRLLDRATRWLLNAKGGHLAPQALVDTYQPVIAEYRSYVRSHLPSGVIDNMRLRADELISLGAPVELAEEVSGLLEVFALLDIADVARRTGIPPETVIPLYFTITEAYGIDPLLVGISALPRGDRWGVLARHALRADLYAAAADLTEQVLHMDQGSPSITLASWEGHFASSTGRAKGTLLDIAATEHPDLATLSVALRALRTLVAQTRE